jgi:16S rRNA (cytidine1402-2'-O)-methyltransferase
MALCFQQRPSKPRPMTYGILYVVATPIGNLEDITARALRILKEVDLIAAEDTRHSLKLLSHFGISKPLVSYWSEKEKTKAEEIINKLMCGANVALISDAGTPGISDPGSVLIRRAIEEKIRTIPLPGPSALIAALAVSGLDTETFTFAGFLPPKSGQRRKRLSEMAHATETLIFYEAPHRIIECLEDILDVLGDRRAAVAKEISKMYEDVTRGKLSEIIISLQNSTIAGEYVVMLEGFQKEASSMDEALVEVQALLKKGLGRKEAVRVVAESYNISKKKLYDTSLEG